MIQKLLTALEADPKQQAKFVNTLSLLEYIGARKILKSQNQRDVSLEVLSHAAEEIRHAYSLKKVALKMSEGELCTYEDSHLLGARAAQSYIQAIDYGVEKILANGDRSKNYLLTTLLLEERANVLYPIYEEFLARAGCPGVLRAIIREEDAHLSAVNEALSASPKESDAVSAAQFKQLRELEEVQFTLFVTQLMSELKN